MSIPLIPKNPWGSSVLIAMAISCIAYVATLLSSVVVARLLGVEGRGVYSLFRTSVFGIVVFSELGFGSGQIFHASKDPDQIQHFLPTAYVLSALLGTSGALLYFLGGEVIGLKTVTALGVTGAMLGFFLVPVLLMLQSQRQFFLTKHAYSMAKVSVALSELLPVLAFVLLHLVGKLTITSALIAYASTQMLLLIVFFKAIPLHREQRPGTRIDFIRNSFAFGIRRYLSGMAEYLTGRLDFFLVTWFLGLSGLGLYAVAVSMAELIGRVPSELGTILFPAFASGRIPPKGAASILRTTVFLAFVMALALAAIGGPITRILFGNRFIASIPVFYCLLFGTVAWSTIYVTGNHVSAAGKPGIGVWIYGAAALLDLLLDLILIPKFGLVGAGLAATASYWLAASLFIREFCSLEGCSLREAILVRRSDLESLLASLASAGRHTLAVIRPTQRITALFGKATD